VVKPEPAADQRVRVAILGTTLLGHKDLRSGLESCGLNVAVEETLTSFLSDIDRHARVDVILVDLEQADDDDLDILDALVEHSPVPLVFHDVAGRTDNPAWLRRLADKLVAAAQSAATTRKAAAAAPAVSAPPVPAAAEQVPGLVTELQRLRCWVLGASFGGPEALKRFLSAVPAVPPDTAFIIGQHIGDGFVEVLASQLNRATPFKVVPAADGARLESGTVYVAPVRERVSIDHGGYLHLRPETERLTYMPSIDALMSEVAARFGRNAGAIIFSGMGDDGTKGCAAIGRAGGVVWAQDSDSCAIDSMPACARATGLVTHSGPPEQLARDLVAYLTEHPAQAQA